jgi:hypothetical protein
MNSPDPNARQARLDEATSRRIAKLRSMPLDTSRLAQAIKAEIPRPQSQSRILRLTWLRPLRAVAASLLVFALIMALVISSSGGPVLASAETLARIHQEVLDQGGEHVMQVDSISAANAALAGACPGLPSVPELGKDHVMSCCVHMIGRKKMACVAMQVDGVTVSVAVADAADVKMPTCEALMIQGIPYHVQSQDGINMVMTERGGRWVCLMGKVPVNRLADLASTLRF